MDNKNNVILAIALSLLVLIGWQYFVAGPQLEAERQRQLAQQRTQAETNATAAAPARPGEPNPVPSVAAGPAAAPLDRQAVLSASGRVPIETPSIRGSINLAGGRLDDLLLTRYRETVNPQSPLIELFSPVGSPNPYYADFGWTASAGGPAVPGPSSVWTAEGGPLAPDRDVTLSWDNGAGLTFRRTIGVDEHFLFTVKDDVVNATGAPVTLYPYALVRRHGLPVVSGYYILHEGLIGVFGEQGLQEIDYDDLDETAVLTPPKVVRGWLGITDKYWAATVIPRGDQPFQGRFVKSEAGGRPTYQADMLGEAVTVPAGGAAGHEALLFAGAKEVDLIDAYDEDLGIERFELLIDWGWFYFLTKPMFYAIDWFYRLLGNFGLAILAVTVIVKLAFFPLANKSYASMSKMKKVQPDVVKLQEQFKEDRMGLQTAMMDLYRREKINPLSGCLPIVIQIPVFFALYKVLFVTIEMRHAPFFGWIRDLSAPDPTSIFNLFGLLPFAVPEALLIGVWPIIMGITMFIQMRMNPTPPDKTQAMIFNWMPLLFTFMLAAFPAGLVIYWAWNNFLSVLQQGLIMKRHGVKIELFGNLRELLPGRAKSTPAE